MRLSAAPGAPAPDARAALLASLAGFFVVALDALVVTVALPGIGHGLGGGMTGLQWVVDGYTLMFAAPMLSAGALADRIGAVRAYGTGLALFTAASALCGLAPDLAVLVGARLLQGAAAALTVPASLAMVRLAFPDPDRRVRAVTVWTGTGAVAVAAGPVAGGALADTLGWRWIFFVNLPVGLLGLALLRRAPRSPRRPTPLDLPGQALGVLALAALTYGVVRAGSAGAGAAAAPLLVAGVAAVGFAVRAARTAHPLLSLPLLRSRAVAVTSLAGLCVNAAFYGSVFVLSLFLQRVHGLSALAAGLVFLPMTALVAVVNLGAAARIIARFGHRAPMVAGLVGAAAGLLDLLAVDARTPAPLIALAVLPVAGAGSLTVPALTAALLGGVPADRAGTAAGILSTARQT
ncbi:MFS transporter, partial [Kitasatospora sp. NPDC058965]|uniref:MFS transporter n=1 Tax=Kitasatospora sp. NPDC058965 TaxID=3346682 RepID=UPI0036B38120